MSSNIAAWVALLTRPPRVPAGRWKPLWPLTGRVVAGAAISILIVAAAMVALDTPLAADVRRLPRWVVKVFNWITQFGLSAWFLWPIGILLLLIAASPIGKLRHFSQLVLAAAAVRLSFIFCAIAIPGLFVAIVKRLIGRARPFASDMGNPFLYAPFGWKQAYASLPSGHATNAFAAAVAIGALWPRARPVMWIYAVLIAVSRVVVNAHHPSDVIAGAIVGTVGALLVRSWFAARRLGFSIGPEGRIHPLSGPSWRRIKQVARGLFA